MGDNDWFRIILVLVLVVLPVLQWIFKKLYKLTQGGENAATSLQRSRSATGAAEDDGEWTIIEDEDAVPMASGGRGPEGLFDSTLPAQTLPTQTRPAHAPRGSRALEPAVPRGRTPQQEITSFLEQLTGVQRPRPRAPVARPAPPPRPAPPRPMAVPSGSSLAAPTVMRSGASLVAPTAAVQGRKKAARIKGRAARKESLTRDRMRDRIVWYEILATPVALRRNPPGSFQ